MYLVSGARLCASCRTEVSKSIKWPLRHSCVSSPTVMSHSPSGTSMPRWHVRTKLHMSECAAMDVCGGIFAKNASTSGTLLFVSSSHVCGNMAAFAGSHTPRSYSTSVFQSAPYASPAAWSTAPDQLEPPSSDSLNSSRTVVHFCLSFFAHLCLDASCQGVTLSPSTNELHCCTINGLEGSSSVRTSSPRARRAHELRTRCVRSSP
mmetsp:Transcript_7436/g.16293  ORF Transcript_7436/g.16293 Transcript_7436/m.16293 type:complete len:206 (+) Transcript_7436:230-847(+)